MSDETRRRLLMAWLAELRARYGTDAAIAARSGLDKSRISRWAKGDIGRGGITLPNLVRLAEVSDHTLGDMLMAFYGVDPDQLTPSAPTATVEGSMVAVAPDRVIRIGSGMLVILESEPPED